MTQRKISRLVWLWICMVTLLCGGCAPVVRVGDSAGVANDGAVIPANGIYEDAVYVPNIKTIQFNYDGQPLYSSVVPIDRNLPLLVTFDELEQNEQGEQYMQYNFQLIHCNADWTKSRLYAVDYLYGFNEYAITDEAFSYNTKVPFVHLSFEVPQVKVPGNYAIKVYRNNDPDDVVFIKRLMVYQPVVNMVAEVVRPSEVAQREQQHQIEFILDYSALNVANPLNDVFIVIRQNWQWYNAIEGLEPTLVQPQDKQLEYRHFAGQNTFYAGNEYRFFDIRTVSSFGQNIGEINREVVPIQAYVLPDRTRGNEVFSQYEDQNGAYFVGNAEMRGDVLNADYLKTHFFLNVPKVSDGEVYVTGAFNHKVLTEENRMRYDETLEGYTLDIMLKQGFYNYQYYVAGLDDEDPYRFEGSFYQTQNLYEIFAYVRPIGRRADLLVGYTQLYSLQ